MVTHRPTHYNDYSIPDQPSEAAATPGNAKPGITGHVHGVMSRSGDPESLGYVWQRDVSIHNCRQGLDQWTQALGKPRNSNGNLIGVYGPAPKIE